MKESNIETMSSMLLLRTGTVSAVLFALLLQVYISSSRAEALDMELDGATKTSNSGLRLDGDRQSDHKAPRSRAKGASVSDTSIITKLPYFDETSITVVEHTAFARNKQFCRIRGVCRIGDGTYMLPAWMKAYSGHIERCGMSDVYYAIQSEKNAFGDPFIVLRGFPRDTLTVKDDFRQYDVVGSGDPPREQKQMLITDLTPNLLLLDIFQRPIAYKHVTNVSCGTHLGTPCQAVNGTDQAHLNPMLLVDARISETKDHHWPKSILRLARNAFLGSLRVADLSELFGWKVRSQASCFRSVISTNASTADFPPSAFLPDHSFFAANSLNRKVVDTKTGATDGCNVKVLILNRYGKRHIVGGEQLHAAIKVLARQVAERHPRVLLQPEIAFFENSSFHEQVSVMQEASVVITSHGSGNANIAFLRPSSRLFEILPFGLTSDLYRHLAMAYGVSYTAVRAQPDSDVFKACIAHFNVEAEEASNRLLAEWKAAADAFRKGTLLRNGNIDSDYRLSDREDGSLRNVVQCATYQRISVDVKHLARQVTGSALQQCGIEGILQL